MKKKCNSKQKEIKSMKQRRCSLCSLIQISIPVQVMPLNNIKRKYYFPQIQTYHYRAANNLIYDSYSRQGIQLAETNKLIATDEILKQFNCFSQTVLQIKKLIHQRVEKDFYGWVDFHDDHYKITNAYYIRRKLLIQNNKKMQKYLKNTGSRQSTGSDDKVVRQYFENKIRRELDNQRLVKLTQSDTNSSTIDLQRLTKNLQAMIGKIADLSVIRPYNPNKANKKIQNNISLLFKLNNNGDISVIDKNKQELIASPTFEKPNRYQQSYGLESIKPKHGKGKKINKMALRSVEQINGFEDRLPPETPKPRFFHGQSQYEEMEFNSPGNWGQKRLSREKKVPISPGNNRSSSLIKKNKSLIKNSNPTASKRLK